MTEAFELPEPSADARVAILSRTLRVQRGRRVMRRAAGIAIVAVAYAAGFATPRTAPGASVPQAPVIEKQGPARGPEGGSPDQERRAILEATNLELAGMLRARGDRLTERGDIESALRCYRQLLKIPQSGDPKAEAGDSWLLAALRRGKG